MTLGAPLNRIESTPTAHVRHWVFAGPRQPILVVGLEPLLGHLHIVLSSWPHHGVSAPAPRPADVLVELNGRSLRIRARTASRWESSLDTPIHAVLAVVGGLICALLVQMDGAVLLHAGAAKVGKGLALLIGDPRPERAA